MQRALRYLALGLLALLGLAQSGLPAFIGETWAQVAMYREYQTIMNPQEALELVLKGDLGCGYFTQLEQLNKKTGAVTLAWLSFEFPLPLPPVQRYREQFSPVFKTAPHLTSFEIGYSRSGDIDPPPPRTLE